MSTTTEKPTEQIEVIEEQTKILGILELSLPGAEFIGDVQSRNESIPDNFPRLAKLNITRFNAKGVFHNRRAHRHADLMLKHQEKELACQERVETLVKDKQRELVKDAVDTAVTGAAA